MKIKTWVVLVIAVLFFSHNVYAIGDTDGDTIMDGVDNCIDVANTDQTNTDGDNFGDACDNCDAVVNNDQADADGDGIGNVCDTDADGDTYIDTGDGGNDCNDANAAIHPGANELCDDAVDNDCDGNTDEADAVDAATWYKDADADTYGDDTVTQKACTQPVGYVAGSTDCDDGVAAVNPGANELCNDGIDNDCDGATDETSGQNPPTWYLDADGDSYGTDASSQAACSKPAGYVSNKTDCDDDDLNVYPGANEACNDGVDNDCDGETDETGGDNPPTWYADADGDTFGDAETLQVSCSQPEGYVSSSTDCDDTDAAVKPGADETCNDEVDNDCDGEVDEDGCIGGADPGQGGEENASSTAAAKCSLDVFGPPGSQMAVGIIVTLVSGLFLTLKRRGR